MKKHLFFIFLFINQLSSEVIIIKNKFGFDLFYCYNCSNEDNLITSDMITLLNNMEVSINIDIQRMSNLPIKSICIFKEKSPTYLITHYLPLYVHTKFHSGYKVENGKFIPYDKFFKDGVRKFVITTNFELQEVNDCCVIL